MNGRERTGTHAYILVHASCYSFLVYRLLGTLDPARVAIFILSLLLITHASQKAVKLDRESRDDASKEGEGGRECMNEDMY